MWRVAGNLLFGVVLTVATAFAAALWIPLPNRLSLTSSDDYPAVLAFTASRPYFHRAQARLQNQLGLWEVIVERHAGVGFEIAMVQSLPTGMQPLEPPPIPTEARAGWPFHCFRASRFPVTSPTSAVEEGIVIQSEWVRDLPNVSTSMFGAVVFGGVIPRTPSTIIPLRPLILPLLGNIAFWTGVGYLLFTFPFWLRTRLRLARGQCVRCRYPVRGLACCPECGPAPLPRTAT